MMMAITHHHQLITISSTNITLIPYLPLQVGSVVEKNPKKCTALVNLGSNQIVLLDYNDVCEHVEQDSS